MNGVGARYFCRSDDAIWTKITLSGRGRTDAYRLICETNMKRFAIGRRIHRNRFQSHLMTGSNDAKRDLASVGDQDLFYHKSTELRRAGAGLLVAMFRMRLD